MIAVKKHLKRSVIAAFVAALAFYNVWSDSGKVLKNVYVGNVNLSHLSRLDAENKIKDYYENLLNLPFKIVTGDYEKYTTLRSIGVEINFSQNTDQAYSVGRSGSWYKNFFEKIKSIFIKKHLPVLYSLNNGSLSQKMLGYFPALERPAQNATLIYDAGKNSFAPQKESIGHIVNKGPIISALEKYIRDSRVQDIQSEVIVDYPQVTLEGIESAKNKATSIVNISPRFLVLAEDELVPLDASSIASFMQFTPDESGRNQLNAAVGTSSVMTFLNTVGTGFNKPTINAALIVEDGKVTTFNLPQEGRTLDVPQSASSIIEALNGGQKEIRVYFSYQQPIVNEEKIKEYGLTAKLGQGASNFYGSSESREFNIALGASKFNGILIKPQEEFSFNQILGNVDKEHGWKAELVIKNGGVSPDYGGGLCQVSTTLFRAAVNSGLQITERYPHAFPVRYYDPQGFDATIYPPSPDLKFINNTPNYIMVQSKIEGNNLTFEIFGTSDKRITKVLGPLITKKNPDGSLNAKLTQQVWKNGEIWFEKTFYSNYKSPNKFKVQRNPLE